VGPFDNIRAADLAPLCASWAHGARYFDMDGLDYVDLVGAPLPFVLGHLHVDVDRAVRSLLNRGISLSCQTGMIAGRSFRVDHSTNQKQTKKFAFTVLLLLLSRKHSEDEHGLTESSG
jgi:acetylornithine/succinyldiaminopimelate/putrescine aminotransferase